MEKTSRRLESHFSKFGIEISDKLFCKFWFEMLFITETLKNMVTVSYSEFISDNSDVDKNPWDLLK